ncbi:MAG: putative TIM-barrel fold metal-dependent hydrolase [Gammaproteobacteria bacterium]|jgi:predicted TIM-barrel fold metal-dependent hydrolase
MTDPVATFPIVDAHHHFWDVSLGKHPWLCREPWIHMRYGDYGAIRRNYMPADYLADAAGFNVVKTVYVETEWDPDDPIGEVDWVKQVMHTHGYPHAVVAQAWMDADNVDEVLATHAASGVVRSVRHKPTNTHSPHIPGGFARGSMSDDKWRAGFALLDTYGLHFDLQVVHWHMREAAQLARDFPHTTLIINHAALPSDRSATGLEQWREALQTIAAEPNVVLKISGIGVPGKAWTVDANRDIVLDSIRIFGADRCMFASNYPVDRMGGDYRTIFDGFLAITADLPDADRRKLFHDNAVRVYSL